jgi:N utilization substance protein A
LNEEDRRAKVEVSEDQQSLAIGRGGQNVRLAAKLTGWSIDIQALGGKVSEEGASTAEVAPEEVAADAPVETSENEGGAIEAPAENAPEETAVESQDTETKS